MNISISQNRIVVMALFYFIFLIRRYLKINGNEMKSVCVCVILRCNKQYRGKPQENSSIFTEK